MNFYCQWQILTTIKVCSENLEKQTEKYFQTGGATGPGSAFDCDRCCKIMRLAYFLEYY